MRTLTVDTHAWIEYLEKNEKVKTRIESNPLETPTIVLTELVRTLTRKGLLKDDIGRVISIVKEKSTVLDLDDEKAERAGWISVKEGLKIADSIIYSYATPDKPLLTGDSHFKGKPNVLFLG
ncbi:PIN domain-containing protein [Candidatus Micrarchaeota archaeon]|nr:PIN domain-containing protein [Candidatus Micrarchaeota archaeon]